MSKTKIVMLDDWENFFSSNLNCPDVAEQIELQIYTNHLVKQDLYQAITDAQVIILLRERTAVDADFIDGSLATFVDTHFQVDGVAHDVYFHRFEAVEQITVVVVKVTDGIVIGHCTLFK